jgi:hypothetical protein
MMRIVLILFGAIIAITLLRSSIGLLAKGLGSIINPEAPKVPMTIEMVKCPSCGSVFAPPNPVHQS